MNDLRKLAHAIWECLSACDAQAGKYHIVWCPKYRYRILRGDVGKGAGEIIGQLCAWKRLEILTGSVQVDHIHLVIEIPPKYTVSSVVGFLKGKRAIQMFDRFPQLRHRLWGRHFWARGYCVSTIGLGEEKIKKYVQWQLKKDKTPVCLLARCAQASVQRIGRSDQLKMWD